MTELYNLSLCVYGGVPKYSQRDALKKGVEVLVATPGRLIDLMEVLEFDQLYEYPGSFLRKMQKN